jgi:hypothetical protein
VEENEECSVDGAADADADADGGAADADGAAVKRSQKLMTGMCCCCCCCLVFCWLVLLLVDEDRLRRCCLEGEVEGDGDAKEDERETGPFLLPSLLLGDLGDGGSAVLAVSFFVTTPGGMDGQESLLLSSSLSSLVEDQRVFLFIIVMQEVTDVDLLVWR